MKTVNYRVRVTQGILVSSGFSYSRYLRYLNPHLGQDSVLRGEGAVHSSPGSRSRSSTEPGTSRSRSRTADYSRLPRHRRRSGSSAETHHSTHGKTRCRSCSRTRNLSRSSRHRRRSVSSNRPPYATPIKTRHGDSSSSDSSEEEASEEREGAWKD